MTTRYSIAQLQELIDWSYFDHAWGVLHSLADADRDSLHADARALLAEWNDTVGTTLRVEQVAANSRGDDIVLHLPDADVSLPMLRQQQPDAQTGACLSLADFVRPEGMGADSIALFATTVDRAAQLQSDDPYTRMLAQTLADRLAEATAQAMSLRHPGIRPAVGYPSMPDMSLNFILAKLLRFSEIGISLTEHGMMQPHASVSGIVLPHPQARYFAVGPVGSDQLADYARRRGTAIANITKYIRQ